jgi:hypothetical protein
MKFKRLLSIFIVSAVFLALGCNQTAVRPDVEDQWSPIKITARGGGAPPPNAINPAQARLMAERAAKVDAMRNLVEQAYGVRIDSRTTVRDFVTQSDTIKARVRAYIQGARVIDTRHLSDGSVEVEMELILGYEFRRMFQ